MSLPSLNLLRTFAVLGDTLSVKRAAERLHVTPTAVSHQLRELETALDCRLFQRLPRGLALTDAGQSFWAEIAPAVRQLESATRARQVQRPLRISSFPYLAQTVVLPALGELQVLLGERLLTLDTRRETLDLATHGIDLGLRFAAESTDWGRCARGVSVASAWRRWRPRAFPCRPGRRRPSCCRSVSVRSGTAGANGPRGTAGSRRPRGWCWTATLRC
jgi:DNA-binding transcriptional LysR family regulator